MSSVGSAKPPISPGSQIHGDTDSAGQISGRRKMEPLSVSVAEAERRVSFSTSIGAPLVPSTPGGKLLSMILQQEPQFFEFAVSDQLNELTLEKDEADAHKKLDSDTRDERIEEDVKDEERQAAIEDLIYMSIANNFEEFEIPMVPKLPKSIGDNILHIQPSKCRELASIHSLEVQEMIKEHVARILRMRGKTAGFDGPTTTKIDRLHLGRIYAASVMYGYFLMSACFRRDLDKSLAQNQDDSQPPAESVKLSSYVKGFDTETLQRCAKIKSKEAVNVIEKHTVALFGGDEIGQSDGELAMTYLYLERNILEAVAFGCFLYDVERTIDSVYQLKEN